MTSCTYRWRGPPHGLLCLSGCQTMHNKNAKQLPDATFAVRCGFTMLHIAIPSMMPWKHMLDGVAQHCTQPLPLMMPHKTAFRCRGGCSVMGCPSLMTLQILWWCNVPVPFVNAQCWQSSGERWWDEVLCNIHNLPPQQFWQCRAARHNVKSMPMPMWCLCHHIVWLIFSVLWCKMIFHPCIASYFSGALAKPFQMLMHCIKPVYFEKTVE